MSTETPLSILIIEDEVSLRTALCEKFTREGFSVFDAKDGERGLAVAIAIEPQLILLDMMMPKMDGMTMLETLRAHNAWSKIVPVLLLTNVGADDKAIMAKISKDDGTHYLVKSNWSMNKIVEKVRETIAGI